MPYFLTTAAETDLKNLLRYTFEKWGPNQLQTYKNQLNERFQQLAKHPEIGRQHIELPDHIFYATAQKHYVFYKEINEGIEILRVLHYRQNLVTHLEDHL